MYNNYMKNFLYDILSDKWVRKNGSIYIYSDPHFSDLDAYKFRFPTTFQEGTEYMQESLVRQCDTMQINNINKVCGKNDTLIILGDVGNIECVKKLKAGYKVLLLGNHDKGASNYKRVVKPSEKKIQELLGNNCDETRKNFIEAYVMGGAMLKLAGYANDNHLFDEVYEGPLMINDRVILSHEPIAMPTYMFNIHGHVHASVPFTTEFHLNVCAEHINYTPINLLRLFKKGLLKDVDNIHRQTIDKAVERKSIV